MDWFWEHGFPQYIKTDNGPQFRQQFAAFCRSFHIRHDLSSPYHPRSNGLAESAVKSMKSLLKKLNLDDPAFSGALLAWRNTPRADGFSPGFVFYSRHLRGLLPDARPPPPPPLGFHQARTRTQKVKAKAAGGIQHSPFSPGDRVLFQSPLDKNWSVGGVVVEKLHHGRSYWIDTKGGRYRRNRRFLRRDSSTITTSQSERRRQRPQKDEEPFQPVRSGPRRSRRIRNKQRTVRFDPHIQLI